MIKSLPYLLIASLLTACGGGGGDPSEPAPASAAAPAPAAAMPAATAPTVLATPPAPAGANYSAGRMTTDTSGGNYQINFNSMTDLTVGGNLNSFWVGAAQPGGTVTVGGASNTFVFKPSATPGTVTVTGSANTFYLPEGSKITLTGAGAAMSTIKYYKP